MLPTSPCPSAFKQSSVTRFGQYVVSGGDEYHFWTKTRRAHQLSTCSFFPQKHSRLWSLCQPTFLGFFEEKSLLLNCTGCVPWRRKKPLLCVKTLQFEVYLLLQHNLAYPNQCRGLISCNRSTHQGFI